MPAVRQVKAFVAQRKIRYGIIPDGQGQPIPIVEGRILDFVAPQLALAVGDRDVRDFSPPAFHQSNGQLIRSQLARLLFEIAFLWKMIQLLEDEIDGLFDLDVAHVGSGKNVAAQKRVLKDREVLKNSEGMIGPHIDGDSRCARTKSDQTQIPGLIACQDSGFFQTREDARGFQHGFTHSDNILLHLS